MSKRKKHNPERRTWRGRSYKNGERVVEMRAAQGEIEGEVAVLPEPSTEFPSDISEN